MTNAPDNTACAGPATGAPPDHLTVVALGDSTTAGSPGFQSPIEAGPDGRGNIQSQYAYWLEEKHQNWRVLNHGINGQRIDEIGARFAHGVWRLSPGVLIVIGGVNDIHQGRPALHVQCELERVYDLARARGIGLVVAGSILPYNTASADEVRRARALNEWIRDYAEQSPRMAFCDTRAAVSDPLHPDRLASSPDDLHPSVEGYRLMALALERTIMSSLAPCRRE